MSLGALFRDAILLFSVFTLGMTAYVTQLNVLAGFHGVPFAFAYAIYRLGLIMVVGLLAKIVYEASALPSTWEVWVYTAGLFLISAGLVGVVRDQRQVYKGAMGG